MQTTLSLANTSYREGDYKAALSAYLDCLTQWDLSKTPSQPLYSICVDQINRCQAAIEHQQNPSKKSLSSSILPKVSIVIPHFNSAGLIYQALDSIQSQSFHHIETIIIDDNSTDNSLSALTASSYPQWMQLQVIQLNQNKGPSYCRNLGIKSAKGRVICFLDADDLLEQNSLKSRWNLIDSLANIGGTFSAMRYINKEAKPLGSIILNKANAYHFRDFVSNKFPCSALMIKKSALMLDPFDEDIIYGEDYECFSRIAQRGWVYHFAADGMVSYRQHGASITHQNVQKDLQNRSNIIQRVHKRELSWSHVTHTKNISSAIITNEISNRSFPIACIFALKGESQKALEIAQSINPDIISARTAEELAGSLRFFISREEYVPLKHVADFVNRADKKTFLLFLGEFFSYRHQQLVHKFINLLFPDIADKSLSTILKPSIETLNWSDFLNTNDTHWRRYLLLHHGNESMPDKIKQKTINALEQHQNIEGIFVNRYHQNKSQQTLDQSAIAPSNPDSSHLNMLGDTLKPALILDEMAARSVKHFVLRLFSEKKQDTQDAKLVEQQCLKSVSTLRLKVVGGIPQCYVIHDPSRQQ